MASERALKFGVAASVVILMALTASADLLSAAPEPRRIVLCALLATIPAMALWRCLRRLERRVAAVATVERPAAGATSGEELAATLLSLESRLEHAPIALFRIRNATGPGAVTTLNASARRLLAPGRSRLPDALKELLAEQAPGQRRVLSFDTERGVERALVAVAALTMQGAAERLVALMPVESELEAEALNAWRELVQVLTHEIMNSLTPVASLSHTACTLLDEAGAGLPPDVQADLGTALDAIARRAASLVDFVGSYRSLSIIQPAQAQQVLLEDLFRRLDALLAPQWEGAGGRLTFSVDPVSLAVMIDPGQLEQALINLLKNAAEAIADKPPEGRVHASLSRGGRLRIEVSDNGPGVPDALAAHIFTPFFSTKKHGKGVGLAMVRHLVHANGGTVRHVRSVGSGARFILTF